MVEITEQFIARQQELFAENKSLSKLEIQDAQNLSKTEKVSYDHKKTLETIQQCYNEYKNLRNDPNSVTQAKEYLNKATKLAYKASINSNAGFDVANKKFNYSVLVSKKNNTGAEISVAEIQDKTKAVLQEKEFMINQLQQKIGNYQGLLDEYNGGNETDMQIVGAIGNQDLDDY